MKKIIIAASVLSTVTNAYAEEPLDKKWSLSLGAFSLSSPDYVGSNDYETGPAPFFDLTYTGDKFNHYIFVRSHGGIGMQTRTGQAIIGASFNYRGGREINENTTLDGMAGVDETPTFNVFWRYGHNQYQGGINISKGLNTENNGLVIAANVGGNCKLSDRVTGSLSFNAAWADDTYMNDYFGVSASEATANRAEYKGESGILSYGVNLGLSYQPKQKHSISVGTSIGTLSKAKNSPIVDSKIQGALSVGYIYSF